MAPRSRRKFSPQFKAEAVQLVIQSERSIAEVAGELEINPGTLGIWPEFHKLTVIQRSWVWSSLFTALDAPRAGH